MFRLFVLSTLSVLALSFNAVSALAAEAQPGDACAINGAVQETGGPEQMPRRTLICNGTTWQNALEQTTAGASLLQIGNDAGSCTTAKLGRIRYNGSATWDFCNGTSWVNLGGATAISSLTSATETNTINNTTHTQSWGWNGITTQNGLEIGSSTLTSGNLLGVSVSNTSSTGRALGVINAGTGTNAMAIYGEASGSSGTTYGIYGRNNSTSGIGTLGYASATTGTTSGVYGQSLSSTGRGVFGSASSTTGSNYGGYFVSPSTGGTGVAGYASATTGGNYAVYGQTESTSGRGVHGVANAASGTTYGVSGTSVSAAGYGGHFANTAGGWGLYSADDFGLSASMYINWGTTRGSTGYGFRDNAGVIQCKNSGGAWANCVQTSLALNAITAAAAANTINNAANTQTWQWNSLTTGNGMILSSSSVTSGQILNVTASNTANTGEAIYGANSSTTSNASAIYGYASGASGATNGVAGVNNSTTGRAVIGNATATSGATIGVYGVAASTTGKAIYGNATATSGSSYAGFFENDSDGGTAVLGVAGSTTGTTAGGSFATASPNSRAVTANAAATTGINYGVHGRSGSSAGFGIYCDAPANANGCGGNRAWYNASDERLKKDIVPLNDNEGLAAIMQLNPVHYKWRDRAAEDQTEMGFLAQEVEQVLPELVGVGPDTEITSDDGAKETIENARSMSYATMVVPLVKAVQELKAENDDLRARLEKLEAQQAKNP
ncbi:tail fiber domain-containing protein [Micavibrio aeruginosavorus]|uniref:tail fiber domain-containing protein n=1 Tax=Micavibrio aeruginosavorus TaxID=349221 RepID=UPI003F4A9764